MSAVTDFAAIAADMARIKAEKEPKVVQSSNDWARAFDFVTPVLLKDVLEDLANPDTAPAEYCAPDYDGG